MRYLESPHTKMALMVLISSCLILVAKQNMFAGTKVIMVSYKESDVRFSKQNQFDVVSLPEFRFIEDPSKIGEPMMPVKTLRVLLPAGTSITNVRIVSKTEVVLGGNYFLCPIQQRQITGDQENLKFSEPKKEVYLSSSPYPGKYAELLSENYFRDYHIAEISIYPMQYLPLLKQITLATDVSIEIEYSVSTKYNLMPRLRHDEAMESNISESLRHIIVNPDDIQTYRSSGGPSAKSKNSFATKAEPLLISSVPSAIEGQNVEYIIITSDALASSFQRLADWKTKKGIVAAIKSVTWIAQNYSGCDIQEKIRHFIQDAYLKWGTECVLLGGDVDLIPGRINSGQTTLGVPILTDLYYSAIYPTSDNWNANGNGLFGEVYDDDADYYADIWVGRAPVHTSNEVNLFVDKIFTYERNSLAPSLPSTTYLTRMVSMAGVCYNQYGWGSAVGIYAKEQVNGLPIPSPMTNLRMYEHESTFNGYYSYDQQLTRDNAISAFNTGYGIVNHFDHSNPYEIATGSLTGGGGVFVNDVDNLSNGNMYSVVYSAGCSPGAYDYDCIGEHFVLKNNGGAVAFIGASRSVYTSEGCGHDYSFFQSLFTNNNYHIGQTLAMARYSDYSSNIFNLLGDPDLPVWTKTPQTLAVTVPATIQVGSTTLTVSINNLPNNQDASICLQKGSEDYAVQHVTGTGGIVTVPFLFAANTTGSVTVTVTTHNFVPFEGTVTVSQSSTADLYVNSYTIDDDKSGGSNGNNDGLIGAGETIQLPVTLRNSGSVAANSVSATLTVYQRGTNNPDPYITVTDGTGTFGNISAGGTGTCSDGFVFSVSPSCPADEVAECRLAIVDNASHSWPETFYLQVGVPQIQHTANKIVGTLQAGAAVAYQAEGSNFGTSVAEGVTATLSSTNPYVISIINGTQQIGNLNPISSQYTQAGSSGFNFNITSSYPPGHPELLTFSLTFQDTHGRLSTHAFDLLAPATPTGLQCIAHETTIDLYWAKNTDTDLKGYNVYRSDSPTGIYQKVNSRLIEGTSYFEDVGLQIETSYWYKVSAIDQSENESNLSTLLETSTTIKYLAGWPIKDQNGAGMFSSPKLFDVDKDGALEVFDASISSGDKVYAWYHSGVELFDIDGNPTTVSGFAYQPGANFWSSPAIADLDGDGTPELVMAGRSDHKLYSWHINDSNPHDGKPDLYWSVDLGAMCLSSPAVGDIDGDGRPEIVVMTEDGKVHIRKYDGTVYQAEPWKTTGTDRPYSTAALADLDGNGTLEIVIGGGDGIIHAWHCDGTAMWAFNTNQNTVSASPTIADIDGDGRYEIVMIAGDWDGTKTANPRVYVLNYNGTLRSGWSSGGQNGLQISDMADGVCVLPSAAVGNLDSDSQLEIVAATGSNVYAWKCNATPLPGWPQIGFSGNTSSPIIANVDQITGEEVVVASADHSIHAWHADGSKVKGWPLLGGDVFLSTPAIGDVDGDGQYEVVAGCYDNSVYVWDAKGSTNKDWPMFHHDVRNTGCYGPIHLRSTNGDATCTGGQRKLVRSSNALYLVYPSNGDILFSKSTDNGVSWSSEMSISEGTFGCNHPSIIERSNSIYAVWQRTSDGVNYDIVYNYSTDGGNSWLARPIVYLNGVQKDSPGPMPTIMASAPLTPFDLLMVWSNRAAGGYSYNGVLQSARTTSSTPSAPSSWTFTTAIPPSSTFGRFPALTYNSNNYPYYFSLAWDCSGTIYSENTSFSNWSGQVTNVSSGAYMISYSFGPSICFSGGNYQEIVWTGNYSGHWAIVLNRDPNNIYYVISDPNGDLSWPSVTGNDGFKATLAWYDYNSNAKYASAQFGVLQNGVYALASGTIFPSMSLNNPPGGAAKCVVTSTTGLPYSIQVPSAIFQKEIAAGLHTVERIVGFTTENDSPICAIGIKKIIAKSRSGALTEIMFRPLPSDTGSAQISPAEFLQSQKFKIPPNTDSLLVETSFYGPDSNASVKMDMQARLTVSSDRSGMNLSTAVSQSANLKGGESRAIGRFGNPVSAQMLDDSLIANLDLVGSPSSLGQKVKLRLVEVLAPAGSDLPAPGTQTDKMVATTMPKDVQLSSYPNPFNPTTRVHFELPIDSYVKVALFDILGRQIAQLADGQYPAGYHELPWDGKHLSSGVYFIRLTVNDGSGHLVGNKICKLLLTK